MPLPENLTSALVGQRFHFDGRALYVRADGGDLVMASRPCDLLTYGGVRLTAGSQGLWIPYQAQIATYGFVNDYDWAASGPFSGCELAIGQHGEDVYVAHISIERNRPEARQAYAEWIRHAPQPVFRSRIRAAELTGNYACYAFVSVDPEVEIVRMDVTTNTIGGTDGTITNIEYLDLNAPLGAAAEPASSSSRRRRRRRSRNSNSRCIIL